MSHYDKEEYELDLIIMSTMRVRQVNEIATYLLYRTSAVAGTQMNDKWSTIRQELANGERPLINMSTIIMCMFEMFDDVSAGREFAIMSAKDELLDRTVRDTAEYLYSYTQQEPIKTLTCHDRIA